MFLFMPTFCSLFMLGSLECEVTYLGFRRLQHRQTARADTRVTSDTADMSRMVKRSSAGSIAKCICLLLFSMLCNFRKFSVLPSLYTINLALNCVIHFGTDWRRIDLSVIHPTKLLIKLSRGNWLFLLHSHFFSEITHFSWITDQRGVTGDNLV